MRIRKEELQVYQVVSSPQEAYVALLKFENALKEQENGHKGEEAFQL